MSVGLTKLGFAFGLGLNHNNSGLLVSQYLGPPKPTNSMLNYQEGQAKSYDK